MQYPDGSSSYHDVTDSKAIQWLTSVERSRLLTPFFKKEVTVGEAAKQLGTDLTWTYKQVKRMEALNLLEQVGCRPRGGRPLRYYRTVAQRFRISPEAASLEETLYQLGHQLERVIARKLADIIHQQGHFSGLYIYLNDADEVDMHGTFPSGSGNHEASLSPLISMWEHLSLDYTDAKALNEELELVLKRYKGKQGGQHSYILRLALVPGSL